MTKHIHSIDKHTSDPTTPYVEVEFGEQHLKLTFDYRALAFAEETLRKQGHKVNLLNALCDLNLTTVPVLFAAAAHHYQPEISLDYVLSKITAGNVVSAREAIVTAWYVSLPENQRPKLEPDVDPASGKAN